MTFLLWQRDRGVGIASRRRVLTAAEVGPLLDAQALCRRAADLAASRAAKIDEAAAAARSAARAEGLEQGRREAREELAATLACLVATAAAERERLRGDVGPLALDVVRKILGQFAPQDVLVGLVRSALREMLPSPAVTLAVHPDRADAIREILKREPLGDTASAARVEVRADPACAPGDCRLETGLGTVDAALEVRLARIAQTWGIA